LRHRQLAACARRHGWSASDGQGWVLEGCYRGGVIEASRPACLERKVDEEVRSAKR